MGIIVESSLHVLESIAGLNMEGKAGGGGRIFRGLPCINTTGA